MMYGYYRRYRQHGMNWLTPYARGQVHGFVFGVIFTVAVGFLVKTFV